MRWCSDMAHPSSFIFGDDFGEERRSGVVRRAQDQAALVDAEERGYAAGFAAGQAAQQASDEGELIAALRMMSAAIAIFEQQKNTFLDRCEVEAIGLAAALAEIHGEILRGIDAHAAFAVAVRDVFRQFSSAPRLVARVPIHLKEIIEERLRTLADEARYSGVLSVEPLSQADAASDFELEWPDGALRFERNAIRSLLRTEYERFGLSFADE